MESDLPIRRAYPSDVSDKNGCWSRLSDADDRRRSAAPALVARAVQRATHVLRYGIAWRAMPNDLPPWFAVYQQGQRWLAAGVFKTLAEDLRALLRIASGRNAEPTAAIIASRTLRSTPESGPRDGYDGAKRKRGCAADSHVHPDTDPNGDSIVRFFHSRCLVPQYDGTDSDAVDRDELWVRYFTGAPARQRRCVERYSIVKRA
jgi:transposase